MRENAVIVRAGRNSRHPEWVAGGRAEFDLIVVAYEEIPNALRECADQHVLLPGKKVAGWRAFLEAHPSVLTDYRYIALVDDDIEGDAAAFNASFDLGKEFSLRVWQPSLTPDSFFSYAITVSNPAFLLRHVNFVEMMCPFFHAPFLREVSPFFSAGYETGVDRLWSLCCPAPEQSLAILDAVAIRHGRPVGENRAQQGFVGELGTYDDVLDQLHETIGMKTRNPLVFSAVTKKRRRISDRRLLWLLSLAPLLRWPAVNGPKPLWKFGSLEKANYLNRDQSPLKVEDLMAALQPGARQLSKAPRSTAQ